MFRGWPAALRLARRTARRSPGRTALIATLIGLPVMASSWAAIIISTSSPSGEALAREVLGTADAAVQVTMYDRVGIEQYMMSSDTIGYRPADEKAVRDPRTVDIDGLLPTGTTRAAATGSLGALVELKVRDFAASVGVSAVDGDSQLTHGTFRLDAGRMPAAPGEVALSPSIAERLGLLPDNALVTDARITTVDGKSYDVVGLARRPEGPASEVVWATPRSPLLPVPADVPLIYLVDLPDGTDLQAMQQSLAAEGVVLTTRANVIDPPTAANPDSGDIGGWAAVALVVGFGVLEVVLLAGTAFAVGARRQTRELGLVTATGGTPTDVRRMVLAQGAVLGAIGAVAGVLLAMAVAVLGKPWWESLSDHLFTTWSFPVLPMIGIALIGLFAGVAAAVVPAISAGRQHPVAALTGRFAAARGGARIKRPAVVLVIAGIASVLVGSSMLRSAYAEQQRFEEAHPEQYYSGATPTGPLTFVLLGITAVIVGLVWLLPGLVAKAASAGRMLPLSGRLAVRDAARHRHRTGPATAAIMMSVGGTVALAFALANSFAAEKDTYVAAGHDGDAILSFDSGGAVLGAMTKPIVYSPGLVTQLADRLPAERQFLLGVLEPKNPKPVRVTAGPSYVPRLAAGPPMRCSADGMTCTGGPQPLTVMPPDYLERFGGFGPAAAAALRDGKVVVSDAALVKDGRIMLQADDGTGPATTAPAIALDGLPRVQTTMNTALVSPERAAQLGTPVITQAHLELSREPTEDELTAVASLLGNEDALQVENGYDFNAGTVLLALLSAATVVTLLGVTIAVALSAAEGRADLATLAAVGAQPRRRRSLAAAQAWLLGQLGCVLGVAVGGLYGYTAHVAFGSPYFAVPWRELAGILVGVPLLAGLLAWLLTRSRLPMVRRVE